jgi:hypothetical protein
MSAYEFEWTAFSGCGRTGQRFFHLSVLRDDVITIADMYGCTIALYMEDSHLPPGYTALVNIFVTLEASFNLGTLSPYVYIALSRKEGIHADLRIINPPRCKAKQADDLPTCLPAYLPDWIDG